MPLIWNDYVDAWTHHIQAAGLDAANLIATRQVVGNPEAPESDPDTRPEAGHECASWPRDPAAQFDVHVRLQSYYLRHPGAPGPLLSQKATYQAGGGGLLQTGQQLHASRGNPERACAVLLNASLHTTQRDSGTDPRLTPRLFAVIDALRDLIPGYLEIPSHHHFTTQTLPDPASSPTAQVIRLAHALSEQRAPGAPLDATLLAATVLRQQISILQAFQPVAICFDGTFDPAVKAHLDAQFERRERKAEPHRKRRAAERAERQSPPPSGQQPQLRDLTKRELTRLVWSKPTMEVARDLGVSDVAVNKACRRLDVLKPPRGFWARVNAGHLPHPEGTPQLTR